MLRDFSSQRKVGRVKSFITYINDVQISENMTQVVGWGKKRKKKKHHAFVMWPCVRSWARELREDLRSKLLLKSMLRCLKSAGGGAYGASARTHTNELPALSELYSWKHNDSSGIQIFFLRYLFSGVWTSNCSVHESVQINGLLSCSSYQGWGQDEWNVTCFRWKGTWGCKKMET